MLLADKVAIVTGVGAGLGKAAAVALAREGATVALVARTESRLREVAQEIDAAGGKTLVVPGSVASADDCARVAETVASELGGIDVLVNSAFRGDKSEPFDQTDLSFWRKVYEVNLWGPLQLAQACVPAMKARGAGSVVNIASMSARLIRPNDGGYSTSKGALLTATKSMAIDLAPHKIRVNAVVPGWIWGPNVQTYVDWQVAERGCTPDEVVAEITSGIPLGEIPPQEDIAEAIVFFASDRMSRMITGQSLDVNGGEFFA
jgi:NAD(P)-dependent dehydrogenase (short-subunit alcohol dehydrogenase family)